MSKKTSKKMSQDIDKATVNVDPREAKRLASREAKRLASLASLESKSASFSSTFGASELKPGALQVTVAKTVTPNDLHSIIDSVLNMSGCRNCGLTGNDVRIILQDDRIQKNFKHIESVKNVGFIR